MRDAPDALAEAAGGEIGAAALDAMRGEPRQAVRIRILCAAIEELAEDCNCRERAIAGFAIQLIAHLDYALNIRDAQ